MAKNKVIIVLGKVGIHMLLTLSSIFQLIFAFIPLVIVALAALEYFNNTLLCQAIGWMYILVELIWQIRISKVLWRKKMFVAPCSHSQNEVVYQNAMCLINYDVYEPSSHNRFLSIVIIWYLYGGGNSLMRLHLWQILLFRSPQVGYCPTCNEVKVQCPYCKHIMPIEDLSNNDFKCLHCGKTNYVH